MTRLSVVLAILGFGLVVLFYNHDSGRSFGIENGQFGEMFALLPIAAMLAVGIVASRRSLGESLRQLAIWVLIIMALVTLYIYRGDLRSVSDRLLAGLMPGRAVVVTTSEGGQEVILHKMLGGHFEASVDINGVAIPMLIDTGATTIALSFEDAVRVGIDPDTLQFSRVIMTANGQARAAAIRLSRVAIGPIIREDIGASVTEPGKLGQSLLGMSFLSTLGSLQIQTDEMRLRD
ncbi:MAG: TIGR02281 family clan AA aspartic protease [Allorhizobium sp.]